MYLWVNIILLKQSRRFTDIKNPLDFRGNYDYYNNNIEFLIINVIEGVLILPASLQDSLSVVI